MKQQKNAKKPNKAFRVFSLFLISLIFVGIAASMAVVGCSYMVNRNFKETFYSVSSLKVNQKIRIIQISDLHSCTFGEQNADLVQRVTKLQPDIIIYTGDGIDTAATSTDVVVNLCAALAKVAPSYYIYGNNEVQAYYKDTLTQESLDKKFGFTNETRDPNKLLEATDALTTALEEVGVYVLKNSMETVTIGTTKVDIYGVLTSNPSSFWSYAGPSFNAYLYENTNNLKITAIHEPLVFETYTPDFWGDVSLAGHTHGGTARIPLLGPVYTHEGGWLPERGGSYVYGRYEVQGRPLIVSCGLENTDFFRINNQPEISIVDINKF